MYELLKPFIFQMPPETAHKVTIKALKANVLPSCKKIEDKRLVTEFCGLSFPNPIGLAAGFDKNAEAISGILGMGFGFVEVGTVTPKPQTGNPTPRIFRDVKTKSVINRMGFPNEGLKIFKENIRKFRISNPSCKTPIGLNIGMNKDQTEPEKDYKYLIQEIGLYADYLTVNVSSPNTPGLRDLQNPEFLEPLLKSLISEKNKLDNKPPLFVKLAPDLTDKQITDISQVLLGIKIDGVILTNTTIERPEILPSNFAKEKGGLSGSLVKDRSTEVISKFYKETKGKVPIIGIGGISSIDDVIEKMRAGASIVQIYTGLIYEGPGLPKTLCKKMIDFLNKKSYKHISNLVGEDHR